MRRMMRPLALILLAGLALSACQEREVVLTGTRYPVDTDLRTLAPVDEGKPVPPPAVPQSRSAPISLPAPQANAEWTHRGGNVRHVSPPGRLSAQPVLAWSTPVGTANSRRARIDATPVAGGGRIFAVDALTTLSAVSASSGELLWTRNLAPDSDRDASISGAGLAYGDGKLFAGTVFGELVALDAASGAVLWRQKIDAPAAGAPAVEGNTVYVVGRNGVGWAINTSDGKIRWQNAGAPRVAGFAGSAAPAVADGRVLLPYASGDVTALLVNSGATAWASGVMGERPGRAYAALSDITGDPVVLGGTVFVGTSGGRTAALSARTGELLWSTVQGAMNPVLPVGGSLFQVTDQNKLVRLDAGSGELIWSVDLPYFTKTKPKKQAAIFAHYGPVLAGGRLAIASSDGLLRLFDPRDGALVATAEIPGGAASAPILTNSALYVMGGDGKLHAFR